MRFFGDYARTCQPFSLGVDECENEPIETCNGAPFPRRLSFVKLPIAKDRQSKMKAPNVVLAVVPVLCVAIFSCTRLQPPGPAPTITFTQVPPANSGDRDQEDVIVGAAKGARADQQLVLYAKVGKLWWVQPMIDSPFTPILPGQVWRNETHLGTHYAALLVDSGFAPSATLDRLPVAGGQIAAVATTAGQPSSSSVFIDFSGFRWRVRTAPSDRGGTSNPYDPRNVSTDRRGALHLRIVNRDARWTCSEINLTRSLGYGTYTFTVEDTSGLEPAAVFGIFTWDYSSVDQNHREFDIEFSRWGDPKRKNAQYVIQPYYSPSNTWPFSAPAGKLTSSIVWEPGRIVMTTSVAGSSRIVATHAFAPEVPKPGSESIRMNLYSYFDAHRKFPPLQHEAEVIVDKFSYLP